MSPIKSYVEFTAFGVYCEAFINELMNVGIEVFDISSSEDIFKIKTYPRNYSAIARRARKFRVKTKVIKRSGVYFTIRRYRKRLGIPFGVLAFFAIIVLMSNYVWSIKITGNERVSDWQILEQLNLCGIHAGVKNSDLNANRAELQLTLTIEELAWVSIERVGSRINVKVSERTDVGYNGTNVTEKIPADKPCDIVAGRSGQLIRTEVYKGELLIEPGNGVNKGDIVVSGAIPDFNDGYNYVHADAKIILEVVETVDFYRSYKNLNRLSKGRSITNNTIVFLGKSFGNDVKVSKTADHVDYSEEMNIPRFLGFPMPFRVLKQRYSFFERVETTDSPAEAREKLDGQITLYEQNFLKDCEIIGKTTEFFPDENGIGGVVRYVIHVDAAVKKLLIFD